MLSPSKKNSTEGKADVEQEDDSGEMPRQGDTARRKDLKHKMMYLVSLTRNKQEQDLKANQSQWAHPVEVAQWLIIHL